VTPADDRDDLEAPETVIDRRAEPRRFSCPEGHHDWRLDTVDGRQVIVCRGCLRDHDDTAVHRRLYDAVAGTHLELAAEHLEVRGRTWEPEGDDDRRGDGGAVTTIRGP
jgi:hypothetical protein